MKHNKNRVKPFSETDFVFEEDMYKLADAIIEASPKTPTLADPFEDYIDVMRTRIHSNPHLFRSRLSKGYSVLLHALNEGKDFSETPPQ